MATYEYNLSNLIVQTRELLQEETEQFWLDTVLTVYINDAIRVITERTGCNRTIETLSTAASTRLVTFAGYKCIAVEYNKIALIKITPVEVGHIPIDGIYPQYWFEESSNIGIEPIPAGIYTLTAYTVSAVDALASASDVADLPYTVCGLIKFYAAARALMQDNKMEAAMSLYSIFIKDLEFMSKALLPNIPDTTEDVRFQ